jgi:four helix bundle protein
MAKENNPGGAVFKFEQLDVWKEAVALSDRIYRVTRRFPDDERFGLTSQMRRCAVSIAANIAEGSGRGNDGDLLRFLDISFGSLMELVSHITIGERLSFLDSENYRALYADSERLAKMLNAFKNSIRRG